MNKKSTLEKKTSKQQEKQLEDSIEKVDSHEESLIPDKSDSTLINQNLTKRKKQYINSIFRFEKLHRDFLEIIKLEMEFRKIEDLSNVQAEIIYNIGFAEVTIAELLNRGYYLGSNVSYNLKKMLQNGYVEQRVSDRDKRSVFVKVTKKGHKIIKLLDSIFDSQLNAIAVTYKNIDMQKLHDMLHAMYVLFDNDINRRKP